MAIVGISGPSSTGKSTLVNLMTSQLPIETIVIRDLHDKVFEEVAIQGSFHNFKEIYKDRDFLLIYYTRLVNYYLEVLNTWDTYDGLVVVDGTHVDLLIYGMLSLWYHKPIRGLLEGVVNSLLQVKNKMSLMYMTLPNDEGYPVDSSNERRYSTGFRRNRELELHYYEIFRDLPHVISLPSSSVLDCDTFIIDDLKSKNLI